MDGLSEEGSKTTYKFQPPSGSFNGPINSISLVLIFEGEASNRKLVMRNYRVLRTSTSESSSRAHRGVLKM